MRLDPRADLKVGFACNNRCVFCAQGEKRRERGAIPEGELIARLAEVRARTPTTRGLVLTGGEPTLHRSLLKLVRAARGLGFHPIQLQSNGRMLRYSGALRALTDAGVSELSLSLHGSNAAIHEGLTRAPGSFADTVEGMRNTLAGGFPLITNSVITRANRADLTALVGLLAELGVRQAQLAFVHPVGTALARFEEVVPRLSECVVPLREAREVALRHGMRLMTEAVPLCFLRGMEELAVEGHIPPTTVLDLAKEPLDYSAWRVAEGKLHGPPCVACAARHRCEGPWREYPEAFGWGEHLPYAAEAA